MTASKYLAVTVPLLFLSGMALTGALKICNISIINAGGKKITARVEIADTWQKRNHGLMFRRVLDKNGGMLFVFPETRLRSFWMKNTYVPLTIAYIDDRGIITQLLDMRPLDTSVTYNSEKPARFALEMKQGWFKRHKISIGSRVLLNGCISQ